MPKPDGFLVDQTSPTSGFMLGDIASTAEGPVTLRYPSGEPFGLPTTCQVVDASNNLLFTVHRAGAEPQPMFSFKPIRKPTIVRDPAGAIIVMLSSDSEKPVTTPPTGYGGYSSRPRFEGQPAKFTVEGVPLYAWFKVWTCAEHCKQVQIYYYAADGSTEKPNAYDHKLYPHMGPPPYKFTTKASGAGVVYGALAGGRYEVTVAKGMDAGLAALASFCPQLLEDEYCRDAR